MRALLSVSDKSGLVELGRGLVERGVELISTGGTARTLSRISAIKKNTQLIAVYEEELAKLEETDKEKQKQDAKKALKDEGGKGKKGQAR